MGAGVAENKKRVEVSWGATGALELKCELLKVLVFLLGRLVDILLRQ